MFLRYAERRGFKTETLNASDGSYTFEIRGDGAYSVFKFEGGTHRVQRVPETESQGRIHTSTATVAVLPEAEEVDVQVDQNDLEIDVYRSSGPGGQSVNTTDSAVRITHKPTGIVVSMQEEKSQLQNRERAMKVLRARLYEAKLAEQQAELAAARSAQVGTGERAEKIRTYNFPERRVTDHRIKHTAHNLDQLLAGELYEFTAALPVLYRWRDRRPRGRTGERHVRDPERANRDPEEHRGPRGAAGDPGAWQLLRGDVAVGGTATERDGPRDREHHAPRAAAGIPPAPDPTRSHLRVRAPSADEPSHP
jgi:protein subunit release factor B